MRKQLIFWAMFLVGSMTLIMFFIATETPERDLEEVRTTLEEALKEGVTLYSPIMFSRAEWAFQAAEQEMVEQQHRWMWERDYSLAVEMLVWAKSNGYRAIEETIRVKQEIRNYHGFQPLAESRALPNQTRQ